jgi:sec-independent protein translocase protein TatC
MTVSDPPKPTTHDYDPDAYRMTIGEHLEELRGRMIRALIGLFIIGAVCLWFGKQTMAIFCAPLVHTLQKYDLSPQLHSEEVADIFMSYIQISLISAAAISAPWMVYQLWQFVAAGLYPNERKYITRYIPLSMALLIAGMLFVYFLVLPWTLEFFIAFSTDVPLPAQKSPVVQLEPNNRPSGVMMIAGDPANPTPGEIWFDTTQKRLKFFINGEVKIISFSAQNLIATEYNMPEYIDLVVGMLLTFGLSFQMPLVVMALARIGIVEIDMLRSFRKYVYFAMSIIAAAITPGDVITATVALMIPLCLLYELGIWLAVMGERRSAREST